MSTNRDDLIATLHLAVDEFRRVAPDLPEVLIAMGAGNGPTVDLRADFAEVFISERTVGFGPVAVLSALAHDAAHLLAERRGVTDTSDRGRYHGSMFAKLAGELGFYYIPPDGPIGRSRYGSADLRPSPGEYHQILKALGDLLPPDRDGAPVPMCRSQRIVRTGGNNLKAVCQCNPVRIIRVSRSTLRSGAIMCAKCNHRFTLQEA